MADKKESKPLTDVAWREIPEENQEAEKQKDIQENAENIEPSENASEKVKDEPEKQGQQSQQSGGSVFHYNASKTSRPSVSSNISAPSRRRPQEDTHKRNGLEKGQIIRIPIKFDDNSTRVRYFLVNARHELFPIIEGYNITSIGESDKRKMQFQTNVPLIPNNDNRLSKPSVVKMNQIFTLDESKKINVVGHLRNDEQVIIDTYEKIYRENGMVQSSSLQNLDDHMRRQYELFNAIKSNDDQKVEKLLLSGAIADEPQQGTTPLHWAAEHGAIKSAAVLMKHGAYVDSIDQDEKTPLFKAVEKDDEDMTRLLLESGANPNIRANGVKMEDVSRSQSISLMVKEYAAAAQTEENRERNPDLKR